MMLIDDNKIDVFVNQRIIEKYDSNVKTRVFDNAISALNFFKLLELNTNIKSLAIPEVILLDVNMPGMDGFKFFKEFEELKILNDYKIGIYMLSSSSCPDDIKKAKNEPSCAGYIIKPLTVDKLKNAFDDRSNFASSQEFQRIM